MSDSMTIAETAVYLGVNEFSVMSWFGEDALAQDESAPGIRFTRASVEALKEALYERTSASAGLLRDFHAHQSGH
ncbi:MULTISPECIES: hypothetical protein [unclassified Rothia (in: high G+C Gram-positive bacteria)]|uniref:hypothetical protein n=1 Tax=unclassified Rothia (in: high G+C Gram-positive bacteria) TaxID=2689056 RepID=UPI00195C5141|nr:MULTISPECIES: hypothetical protein [unclassified Rothia (in: high G+C Gram-positive bacteria)]MBM7052173.1 hypothetical protein [Rothia sp. ZJ1223]QRZ61395.1 hypothetical protein JR346_09245 [Rothia sp. ZJ932]